MVTLAMATRSVFKRKLQMLRHNYGISAVAYFKEHYTCEICGEKRLATLNVHHRHGKTKEDYQTLCFNCHMVIHYGAVTYEDELLLENEKNKSRLEIGERNRLIRKMNKEGRSLRQIGKIVGLSHISVRRALLRDEV